MDRSLTAGVREYLDRIGYSGSSDPTLETLTGLVTAHTGAIPFENLDPLTGTPVFDLSPQALHRKLVRRRRGGYCYEHNGLMRYVLSDLGFDVDALAGRVVWMIPDEPLPAQTHHVLAVRIPGIADTYLVDVGFGGQTLSSPIRLEAGLVQETRHEPYRLLRHGDGLVLESLIRDTWQPLYIFTEKPRPLIDLQVGSWYVSTYPESNFVRGLSAAIVTDDGRWNLRGRNLAVHGKDGQTERTRFDTAAEVLDALTNQFGIDVTGIENLEARVHAVLDT